MLNEIGEKIASAPSVQRKRSAAEGWRRKRGMSCEIAYIPA